MPDEIKVLRTLFQRFEKSSLQPNSSALANQCMELVVDLAGGGETQEVRTAAKKLAQAHARVLSGTVKQFLKERIDRLGEANPSLELN